MASTSIRFIVSTLHDFLPPPTEALLAAAPFTMQWTPGDPWTERAGEGHSAGH